MAQRLKIDRSTIANLMRLLELPQQLQAWVQDDKLTAGHARALLPLGDESEQLDFAQRILSESWTVRDTERMVSEYTEREKGMIAGSTQPKSPKGRALPPQIAALEKQLRLSLGTKVEIRPTTRGRGKLVIQFSSPDEFDRICDIIQPSKRAAA